MWYILILITYKVITIAFADFNILTVIILNMAFFILYFIIYYLMQNLYTVPVIGGARSSIVGWGTMLQARRSRVRVPKRWIFFSWPNPYSRTMALGSTQPLTDMSIGNLPGGKGQLVHKADNLTAIYEPIV
jgi:hypothetical protein